jgi:hypothetical protein
LEGAAMLAQIDPLTVLIIFVGGLVAIGLSAWMLNRAWGNFPSRAGLPPAPLGQPMTPAPDDAWDEDEQDEFDPDEEVQPGEEDQRPLPAGASSANLVEVTHPMVRQAVQRAMEKPGSPYATYFIDEGDRVYLVLSRIADPIQREQARRLFEGLNGGDLQGIGMGELMQLISQLGKR